MFERANPRAWQTAFTGRPRSARGERAIHFFSRSVLRSFLEDLVLQRLLAKHALKLGDLGTSGCQLRGRHHSLASRYGRTLRRFVNKRPNNDKDVAVA